MTSTDKRPGRIITFYSYKGGTGRSMAIANLSFILASNGLKVLAIDWDLEAPGLHRYFHPFLEDKELETSAGLIDFFVDFSAAARIQSGKTDDARRITADPWYEAQATLVPYAYSLDWEFPGEGTVDFVPAGRQDAGYPVSVNSFDWDEFYKGLGGGVFLELVKKRIREEYDYILIDSRTGISDTSGICTVQMPDDLVVCFTLNQQSMKGASAVASSAWNQRKRGTGEPSLRVWPVPTRIELGEKERLDSAREHAHSIFQKFIGHLPRTERPAYWQAVETLYQPFFAYEEVLAVFAERRHQTASLLSSLEALCRYVTEPKIEGLGRMSEQDRKRGLSLFTKSVEAESRPRLRVFISYNYQDGLLAGTIFRVLPDELARLRGRLDVSLDSAELIGTPQTHGFYGSGLRRAIERADAFVCQLGRRGPSEYQRNEISYALAHDIPVLPVLSPDADWDAIPKELEHIKPARLEADSPLKLEEGGLRKLAAYLDHLLRLKGSRLQSLDPEDPQKGRFGGSPSRNGLELSSRVMEGSPGWFEVLLQVRPIGDRTLPGTVDFYLHPTFGREMETVKVVDGLASLRLSAWGAFTVGAVADNGETELELDLSQDASLPSSFRER